MAPARPPRLPRENGVVHRQLHCALLEPRARLDEQAAAETGLQTADEVASTRPLRVEAMFKERRQRVPGGMLLVADTAANPLLALLSSDARSAWLGAVGRCDLLHTDILEPHELDDHGVSEETVDEWEQAALVARLPFGNVRFLARGLLWDLVSPSAQAA